MDERAKRLGQNEATFRRANERIESVAHGFSLVSERSAFVCECALPTCVEPIELTIAEYEHVRSESTWFVVVPGHEVLDIEKQVEQHATYTIVEKLPGGPAGVAIREDDRRN